MVNAANIAVKNGFLVVDGVKVCRVLGAGLLEVKDKDGRRARRRGSAFVRFTVHDLAQAMCEGVETK